MDPNGNGFENIEVLFYGSANSGTADFDRYDTAVLLEHAPMDLRKRCRGDRSGLELREDLAHGTA